MYRIEDIQLFLNECGRVDRFHTVPMLERQPVGLHSWGVALLCEYVTGGFASKTLILCALTHDLHERDLGDIPAPAKRAMHGNGVKEAEARWDEDRGVAHPLREDELAVLKVCDKLDFLNTVIREMELGNRHNFLIRDAWNNGFDYMLLEAARNLSNWHPEWTKRATELAALFNERYMELTS